MKNWILLTLFLPAMIGCCATHRLQTSNEKWNSPSKLERIARDYARQHEIEFDFATAHPEVGWTGILAAAVLWLLRERDNQSPEPDAAPDGGPAMPFGQARITEGPPSVS